MTKDECIICYEKDDLIHFPNSFSSCKCVYKIHKKCYNEWLKNNNSCIICRNKNNNTCIISRTENKNKNICSLITDFFILVFIYEMLSIFIHLTIP